MLSIRNMWNLPDLLEYFFNLLPLMKKMGVIKEAPAGVA